MIDLEAARQLLDFGRRIGSAHRAEEQLRGAVAVHNLLERHRVAYLADEVGMGKTYVALGALALFRHYAPNFRALVIAPRENIQRKWQKELHNFTAHNVRVDDLRVRAPGGLPVRPLVSCENLLELVRWTSLDPDRDFFVRLSSFSVSVGNSAEELTRMRDRLFEHLPWLDRGAFDLRKDGFKQSFARAVCCALPVFDLVIVDEAHNLKHGVSTSSAARNRVLAEAFGRHLPGEAPSAKQFPGYGRRARRVLFLSATPLEETYQHVWNQLDVFGLADQFGVLRDASASEEQKKSAARSFVVRRVTSIKIGERELTRNLYRREWRAGGVAEHDSPIEVTDPRQRLIVALVQKKVSEVLGEKRFNHAFQIGMLASFESFLETAKVKRRDDEDVVFDDPEQTDDEVERTGVDVDQLNGLARDYRRRFGTELPHPKMDAVVERLATAWGSGSKSLVFVRRVASVKELKRKLDDCYDQWLIEHLRRRLAPALRDEFSAVVQTYSDERRRRAAHGIDVAAPLDVTRDEADVDDRGGVDTFFAWFFRGDGPDGVLSGARVRARFVQPGGAYATFFADNYVMALLGALPGGVVDALASAVNLTRQQTVEEVRRRAANHLSRDAMMITRAQRMEASQAAALDLLRERGGAEVATSAEVMFDELFARVATGRRGRERDVPAEIAQALERETFFTELRRPERASLRARLWPAPRTRDASAEETRRAFREQVLRAELLAAAARMGHAYIDLYLSVVAGRASLQPGRAKQPAPHVDERSDSEIEEDALLRVYLDALEAQRGSEGARPWAAFDELSEIAANFELILDVNAPDARTEPLAESARYVSRLLRQQQPTGGMSRQVNQTLVRQFRMPGYPFVLITTDLLQEGEDLHSFCSSVMHYGISWTPSSMEQRVGRIDRVRSQSERRLTSLDRAPRGDDWLQVYYPHLQETVEVLQVERVLDRMDTFLRLMHEGFTPSGQAPRQIDIGRELVSDARRREAVETALMSAFPIPEGALRGEVTSLAVEPRLGEALRGRFAALQSSALGGREIEWSKNSASGSLLGTARLPGGRRQPFTLLLRADHGRPVVRCISPVGRANPKTEQESIAEVARAFGSRVGAIVTRDKSTYDLTVEDDVTLVDRTHDAVRVGLLVRRVTDAADAMERAQFGDARDAAIDEFIDDLDKEGAHAR